MLDVPITPHGSPRVERLGPNCDFTHRFFALRLDCQQCDDSKPYDDPTSTSAITSLDACESSWWRSDFCSDLPFVPRCTTLIAPCMIVSRISRRIRAVVLLSLLIAIESVGSSLPSRLVSDPAREHVPHIPAIVKFKRMGWLGNSFSRHLVCLRTPIQMSFRSMPSVWWYCRTKGRAVP